MPGSMVLQDVRWGLAKTWLIGAAALTLLLLALTFSQRYSPAITPGEASSEELSETGIVRQVWEWFVPHLLPTLCLILSVLGADAVIQRQQTVSENRESDSKKTDNEKSRKVALVDQRFYWVLQGFSISYFAILLFSIFLPDFVGGHTMTWLLLSNVWLSPFQSMVVSGIGIIFFTARENE